MFRHDQLHHRVIACPQCGTRMYPSVTESLPHGMHRTTFCCDDCQGETQETFRSEPGAADWSGPLDFALSEG